VGDTSLGSVGVQPDPVDGVAIERWFTRRGVPHLIEDYAATTDIWTRSAPLLLLAYVAGGFNALDLEGWSLGENLLGTVLVVGVLLATWAVTNLARRRPLLSRPTVIGAPELAAFVLGPGIPSAIVGQWGDVAQSIGEGLVILAVVYVTTSYALVALSRWALGRSIAQLGSLVSLVARALPLLLLFTTFLFINAEVWQVAGTLQGTAYLCTLGIFFLLGTLFVLSRIPAFLDGIARFDDWGEIAGLVANTPAAAVDVPAHGDPDEPPMRRRQRLNVGLVAVFSQAQQITTVAVLLSAFFVLFGLLAIPESTTAAWTTLDHVHVLLRIRLDGRELVITEPLLRVAGFLGAFTGMYFTVVLSTDSTYREEFAEDVEPQIRETLAVRVAYLWHRSRGNPSAAQE